MQPTLGESEVGLAPLPVGPVVVSEQCQPDRHRVVTVVAQASHEHGIAAFVRGEFHRGLPEAGTISSAARWSAANAAAARRSSIVKCG